MRLAAPLVMCSLFFLAGCSLTQPWDRGLPVPVYGPKIEEPKIEPRLQSTSIVKGQILWKFDHVYTKDINLHNKNNGFGKDIWHEYVLDVLIDAGDHEEGVEFIVSKELFESLREMSYVNVKRSLYDDGSRAYELSLNNK